MKCIATIKNVLAGVLIMSVNHAFGWGTDKVISPFAPTSQHSMAAKQNGVLFAAMPGAGITGPNIVTIYTSVDNGDTWNLAPVSGLPVVGPVLKTKMVVTSLDSIYCLFTQNNSVNIINVESGSLGQFNQTGVDDFDAAGSQNGNWIYMWVDEPGNNSIKRYGTVDGGLTWTGNTATVTSNGAHPRITLSGTRLILNYYGPVLPDTATSVIRAAFYNETAPGNLAAGTFQDVALGTGAKRKQYQTVLVNGFAWFIFTEGDTQQVLKFRSSTDNGVTYQAENIIGGNASINAFWFGAAPFSNPIGSGVTLTYLADSIAPVTLTFSQMQFLESTTLSPGIFSVYPLPYNTYNDTNVTSTATEVLPVLVNYNSGSTYENGVAWIGDSPQGPWLFFDRLSATVGINETINHSQVLNIYPSPASGNLNVRLSVPPGYKVTLQLLNMEGKLVKSQGEHSFSGGSGECLFQMDISTLSPGNYIVKAVAENQIYFERVVIR